MKATNLKLMAYKSYIYEMNRETKLWLIKAVPTKKWIDEIKSYGLSRLYPQK
jgi:hypothetical protein